MDDELYKILFDYVKNQKWDKFKEELKKLDKNFPKQVFKPIIEINYINSYLETIQELVFFLANY